MAELRFSSRRRNNYAGNGRRIYANSNELQAEMQGQDWVAKLVPWEARRDNRKQEGIRPEEEERVQVDPDDGQVEIRRESSKHASGKGYVSPDQREALKQAATLLLVSAGDVLFADLCESCSIVLQHRLISIASGEGFSAFSTGSFANRMTASRDRRFDGSNCTFDIEERCPILVSPDPPPANASVSENGLENHHTEETAAVDSFNAIIVTEEASRQEVIVKKDDGSRQAFRQESTVGNRRGSAANGFDDGAASLIIKSALHTIRNTPAYRTRSMSRQAGLLQTPHQNSESANGDGESVGILKVKRKKDFCLFERVNGQVVNILQGLELHCNVFDSVEQKELIEFIYGLQELGRNQKLRKRTYSEPRKWMRGKGRVTIQFGCCYNYAVDKDGNPPGIIRDEEVDEIPTKLRTVIKRLVQWRVLPPSCVPDSCIINIYDVGDCIPPHIDHHDFVRPFCTLSLLSECNIIFGTNLKIVGPGEFKGSISVPLPTGSVLILNGNGADIAKHAVPAVPTQRISITFRKMDPTKVPHGFRPDKELLSTQPITNGTVIQSREAASVPHSAGVPQVTSRTSEVVKSRTSELSQSREAASVPHSAGGPQVTSRTSEVVKSRTSEVAQFSLDSDFPALAAPVSDTRHKNLRS